MITSQHKPRDVLIFVLLQLKYWYKLYVCTQRKKNYKYKSVFVLSFFHLKTEKPIDVILCTDLVTKARKWQAVKFLL